MEPKLIIIGGVGIINTWNVKGKFEVQYSKGKRIFTDYYEAALFYKKLDEPASFWDKTKRNILLEQKDWENNDDQHT